MSTIKRASWKDVVLAITSSDVSAVAELNPSKAVLKKALKEMKARGQDTAPLEAWCREVHGINEGRVTRSPREGDSRTYKVQRQGYKSTAFLKIPVEILGLEVGDQAKVTFSKNGIKIKPSTSS